MIWNLLITIYRELATLRSFFKLWKKNFNPVKKMEKIHIYTEKSMNSFEKKDKLPDYLRQLFF